MPLPKGIYSDPAVRLAWIGERRAKLATFDRLTRAGLHPAKAAQAIGTTRMGAQTMRESIEQLESGQTTGRTKGERIDLGLALLAVARTPDARPEPLTARDIAAWCDCTPAAIQSIERRALAKLQRRLQPIITST